MLVAIVADLYPLNQLHHKIRSAVLSGPSIEYMSDVRMVHQRQRLSFCLDSGNDTPTVHAGLDDFQSDPATDGFLLFRDKNQSATSFTDLIEELVSADLIPRSFAGHASRSPISD